MASDQNLKKSIAKVFKFDSIKMASTSGGGYDDKRRNSGRKRSFLERKDNKKDWDKSHKRISLENTIFQSWLQTKFTACATRDSAPLMLFAICNGSRRCYSVPFFYGSDSDFDSGKRYIFRWWHLFRLRVNSWLIPS